MKLQRIFLSWLIVIGGLFPITVFAVDTDSDGVPDGVDSQPLVANPVQLDALFANGGTAVTAAGDFSDGPMAMVLQADGKPVLAGVVKNAKDKPRMVLVRYNSDGSLDTGFDGDGKLFPDVGSGQSYATAIVQQPDGKLVVAGTKKSGNFVASVLLRYLPDGSLDTSFGKKGVVVHKIGVGSTASSLVILPDGRIAAAGFTLGSSNIKFYIARYKANGSLDRSFGNSGVRVVGIAGRDAYAYSLLRQSDGKLVAAGSARIKEGDYTDRMGVFALLRLNENGSRDRSFGADGIVTTSVTRRQDHTIFKVIQQSDGKLVATGPLPMLGFVVTRYNTDGSLDTGFSDDGIQSTGFIYSGSEAASILSLPDGRLVVAGHASTDSGDRMALAFYKQDGSLDTAVNGSGKVTVPSSYPYSEAVAMAQQSDGRLLLAGVSGGPNQYGDMDFTLVRLFAGDSDSDGIMDTVDAFPLDTDNDGVNNVDELVP